MAYGVLARDLHLGMGELDALTLPELRWWLETLRQVRQAEKRGARHG